MNQELQKKLFEKYPEIFVQKDYTIQQSAMPFGIECGDGWYNIIDTLCWHIQQEVDRPHEDIEKYTKYLEDSELPEATVTYFQQQIVESRKVRVERQFLRTDPHEATDGVGIMTY